jgi:hypothetical protein
MLNPTSKTLISLIWSSFLRVLFYAGFIAGVHPGYEVLTRS